MTLFANMGPPSYLVTLPRGEEWAYEYAAWAFVAVAVMAAGVWVARRQTLRPAVRRALLWLAAGSLAVAYSGGWLWTHRDAGVVPPGPAASLAVWMYGFWGVGAAVVVIAGWRHVRGGTAITGRSFALAFVTLGVGYFGGAAGFQPALLFILPGYFLAELVRDSEAVYLALFFGVNVALWWAAWAFVLWARQSTRETGERGKPGA